MGLLEAILTMLQFEARRVKRATLGMFSGGGRDFVGARWSLLRPKLLFSPELCPYLLGLVISHPAGSPFISYPQCLQHHHFNLDIHFNSHVFTPVSHKLYKPSTSFWVRPLSFHGILIKYLR